MERKIERKWRTLRSVASQKPTPEEEVVSVPFPEPPLEKPEPVDEEPVHEEPVSEELVSEEPVYEEPVEKPLEDTSKIRVSAAPRLDVEEPDIAINEDRDWIAPEAEASLEAISEVQQIVEPAVPEEDESEAEVAVFEELENPQQFFATAVSMGPESIPEPTREPREEVMDAGNRILIAHGVKSTSRLIRETLENFTEAEVESTSDPVRAFELALQKPFRRFFFAMQVGELSGSMLYELISKAYANGRATRTLAPGVVFIREKSDPQLPSELARDARVKDIISKPIRIERLLKSVGDIFEVRDPTLK